MSSQSERPPHVLHEPIELAEPDPRWAEAFERERSRLREALGGRLGPIEHIGSTAVAGLCAKPIVDILAGVESVEAADRLRPALAELGYHAPPELEGILIDRRFFLRRAADGERSHHLHLLAAESPSWRFLLRIRDRLRSEPDVRREYEELKRALAQEHRDDRLAYMNGKTAFFDRIAGLPLAERLEERRRTLAQPQLAAVHDAWLASLADPELRARAAGRAFIGGGCVASILLDEAPNDFDMYMRDAETLAAIVAYYRDETRRRSMTRYDASDPFAGADADAPCRPLTMTANAIYFSNRIQLSTVFTAEPEAMMDLYDFDHCRAYWTSWERRLRLRPEAFHAISRRELRIREPGVPAMLLHRVYRFARRGWKMDGGQLFKAAVHLSATDFGDRERVAWVLGLLAEAEPRFHRLIAAIESEPGERLDRARLCELVDRAFDGDPAARPEAPGDRP